MHIILKQIKISPQHTHHLHNNQALYAHRFICVGKFHEPGLAPVCDDSGCYHIDTTGNAAYSSRFTQSFGFYDNLAAVTTNDQWFHILTDGTPAYNEKFAWVGNFQEGLCVAKYNDGFVHIKPNGSSLYSERYSYVGDFKDGIAVVYSKANNLATHIDIAGQHIHKKWFKQLDIYHKNYARAEDENGWFHIDINGNALYDTRYKMIEPFYNGFARVECFDGRILQINTENLIINIIKNTTNQLAINQLFDDLVGFWKTHILATAAHFNLFALLPDSTANLAYLLNIPVANIKRLLMALWELKILTYDYESNVWVLDTKGQVFLQPQYIFLKDAAIMWSNVANQDWIALPILLKMENIHSHKSFKDLEQNNILQHTYNNALEGYLNLELDVIIQAINTRILQNTVCVGSSTKKLASLLIQNQYRIDTAKEKLALLEICNNAKYQTMIFLKFFLHHDDQECLQVLRVAHKQNVNIIIIETIRFPHSPTGSMLDLNMLVESGGKIRDSDEWTALLAEASYVVQEIRPLHQYLTMLCAKPVSKL